MSGHEREFRNALLVVAGAFVVLVLHHGWGKICTLYGVISTWLMSGMASSLAVLNNSMLVTSIIVLAMVIAYFLPSVIAFGTHKRNAYPIFLCNLLFGWSLVGWAVAMLWAAVNDSI